MSDWWVIMNPFSIFGCARSRPMREDVTSSLIGWYLAQSWMETGSGGNCSPIDCSVISCWCATLPGRDSSMCGCIQTEGLQSNQLPQVLWAWRLPHCSGTWHKGQQNCMEGGWYIQERKCDQFMEEVTRLCYHQKYLDFSLLKHQICAGINLLVHLSLSGLDEFRIEK